MDKLIIELNLIKDKIDAVLKKHNIDPKDFLISGDCKSAHTEIMEIMGEHIKHKGDHLALRMAYSEMLEYQANSLQIVSLSPEETEYNKNLNKAFFTYLTEFIDYYYKIENGKLIMREDIIFKLPSMDDHLDFNANKNYLIKRTKDNPLETFSELPMLITPDGTCYQAQGIEGHLGLAKFLNANGIDINNAIRFEANKGTGDFVLTSLYNYHFSLNSTTNQLMEITREQADVIGCLYDTISKTWIRTKPFKDELRKSSGFGIGKNTVDSFNDNPLAAQNLKRLHLYSHDHFTSSELGEYVKDLRLSTTAHNPLGPGNKPQ